MIVGFADYSTSENSNLPLTPLPPGKSSLKCLCFPIANTICKQCAKFITYTPSLGDCEGLVVLKDIVTRSFDNAKKYPYLKICVQQPLEKRGVGEGLVALQYFGH